MEIKKVTKLVLASGKMFIDLKEHLAKILTIQFYWAVDRLYPFLKEIKEVLNELPNLETVSWVQEEPKNQGAWLFVYPYLKSLVGNQFNLSYHGRIQRAAPAEGDGEFINLFKIKLLKVALKNN